MFCVGSVDIPVGETSWTPNSTLFIAELIFSKPDSNSDLVSWPSPALSKAAKTRSALTLASFVRAPAPNSDCLIVPSSFASDRENLLSRICCNGARRAPRRHLLRKSWGTLLPLVTFRRLAEPPGPDLPLLPRRRRLAQSWRTQRCRQIHQPNPRGFGTDLPERHMGRGPIPVERVGKKDGLLRQFLAHGGGAGMTS